MVSIGLGFSFLMIGIFWVQPKPDDLFVAYAQSRYAALLIIFTSYLPANLTILGRFRIGDVSIYRQFRGERRKNESLLKASMITAHENIMLNFAGVDHGCNAPNFHASVERF